jgi:hypothetical protein
VSASERRALVWVGLIALALLAGAWGVLSLLHPRAAFLPGFADGDLPPVWASAPWSCRS